MQRRSFDLKDRNDILSNIWSAELISHLYPDLHGNNLRNSLKERIQFNDGIYDAKVILDAIKAKAREMSDTERLKEVHHQSRLAWEKLLNTANEIDLNKLYKQLKGHSR